jgi:hypothetical protein
MSAYAATARIDRVVPRLVVGRSMAGGAVEPVDSPEVDDLVDVAVEDPLLDRLIAARERWSQLTFFLFDPNSWR